MMVIKKIAAEELFIAEENWRTSRYHFSFTDYKDPTNNHYGVLRFLNDELIQPRSGFDMHPHEEMEIISYCVQGELSHSDSMGNQEMIRQEMSNICVLVPALHMPKRTTPKIKRYVLYRYGSFQIRENCTLIRIADPTQSMFDATNYSRLHQEPRSMAPLRLIRLRISLYQRSQRVTKFYLLSPRNVRFILCALRGTWMLMELSFNSMKPFDVLGKRNSS